MSALPGRLGPIKTGRLAGGLLASARVLPATYDEWRQGINFNTGCNPDGTGLIGCVDPEDATDKNISDIGVVEEFSPFLAYSGRSCSTWVSSEELIEAASQGLESTISKAFATQLQLGTVGTNPSLNSTATDITPGGGPVDLVNTFSGLVQAICECGINDLTFHVNLRAIPFLLERQIVKWDADSGTWKHGPYTVSADCYGTVGPGEDEENVDGSEVWVYVTGPIEVGIGDAQPVEGLDVQVNGKLELVERLGILRFDTCCVYAAKAELF